MNKRIKLHGNNARILSDDGIVLAEVELGHAGGVHVTHKSMDYIDIDALLECLNCARDIGDFSALLPTDARPFVGKRMRLQHTLNPPDEITIEGIDKNRNTIHWRMYNGKDGSAHPDNIRPLSPAKPKVRPYTPVEAAAHLGREFVTDKGNFYILRQVSAATIVDPNGVGLNVACCISYSEFATCLWADSREPCGVPTGRG